MKKALLIGINNYPLAPLFSCVNDAEAIAELLRHNGDQDESPNFDDVDVKVNVQTRAHIYELIGNLFKNEDDLALFYFSGHGGTDSFDSYLVAPDSKAFDLGVSLSVILKIANESKCKNKVIILDCCYAGAFGNSNLIGGTSSIINNGVTVLAASRPDEKAICYGGHSIFTSLLIEALKGGAADISGSLTPGGVYAYIDKALGAFSQRPVFKTNVMSFVSLRKVKPAVPFKILRNIIKHFPEPDASFPLNPSYEDTNSPEVEHKVLKPYAIAQNVRTFKELQLYQSAGLVIPVDAPFMYFAAMESKACRLTPLGKHYWDLAKENRIRD